MDGQQAPPPDDEGAAVAADNDDHQQQQQQQQTVKAPLLQRQHSSARRPGPLSTTAGAAAGAPAPAAEGPSQLAGVWHHLKQLEKAVKSHLHDASTDGSAAAAAAAAPPGPAAGSSDSSSSSEDEDSSSSSSSRSREGSPTATTAAAGRAHAHAATSPARVSERAKLRDSLSKIKSEIAHKAVKAVEAQLLQQRVACLEAALSGLTGSGMLASTAGAGAAGCASCAASFAGSMLSLSPGGRASAACLRCQSQPGFQQQQHHQSPRASVPMRLDPAAGVSQLYDRLGDMEAAMRDLAHAQATSSSVLSELGGRLGTSSTAGGGGSVGSGWPASSHAGLGSSSPLRGSLLRRPPSCPINDGQQPMACWSFCSPQAQRPSCNSMGLSPLPHRPSSACAMHGPPSSSSACHATTPGGFSSVLSNPVYSPESPQRCASPAPSGNFPSPAPAAPAAPEAGAAPSPAAAAAAPAQAAGVGDSQQPQQQQQHQHQLHSLLQKAAHQQAQQAQQQHTWHVDVVLASHDAELASVKDAVARLEAAQDATASMTEDTAMHTASLDDRLRVLEHGWPALIAAASGTATAAAAQAASGSDGLARESGLEATLSRGMVGAPAEEAASGHIASSDDDEATAAGQTPVLVADDALLLQARVSGMETASARQQAAIEDLQAELHQTHHTMSMMSLEATSTPPPAAAATSCGPQAVLPADMTGSAATSAAAGSLPGPLLALSCTDQAALVRQLLSSQLLEDAITARVQQAVSAQLAAAAVVPQGSAASLTDASASLSGSGQLLQPEHHLQQQQQQHQQHAPAAPAVAPIAASSRSTSSSSRSTSSYSNELDEAAEQQVYLHNMLHQLHGRLLHVEATVQQLVLAQQSEAVSCDTPAEQAAVEPAEAAEAEADTAEAAAQCSAGAAADAASASGLAQIQAQLSPRAPSVQPQVQSASATLAPEEQQEPSAAAARLAAEPSGYTSTTQIEQQVTELQDEVEGCQTQAMQAALDRLTRELQQLHQQQAEQALRMDSHRVSTGASVALLLPLEPQVEHLSGQVGSLAAQVTALHALASQQPERFEVLQGEIEQLSQHLAEVNGGAAEEADVDRLREQLLALQQQHSQLQAELEAGIRAATEAAAAAAVMASAAAEAAADVGVRTQEQLAAQQGQHAQLQGQAAEAIVQQLAAVEGSVQHLSNMQSTLSQLQEKVDGQMEDARQAAAAAAAASQQQQDIIATLAEQTSELAGRLRGVDEGSSVGEQLAQLAAASAASSAAAEAQLQRQLQQQTELIHDKLAAVQAAASSELQLQLQQQAAELQASIAAAAQAQDADMQQQLQRQANSVAQQLAEAEAAATSAAAERTALIESQLQQQACDLRAAFTEAQEAHDADLKQQLAQQLTTMAQILADVGCHKAEQVEASRTLREQLQSVRAAHDASHAEHSAQLEHLTDALQQAAQQLKDELSSSITPLQSQLQAATATLAEHGTALEGTRSVAAAVQALSGLPAAAAELSARLDELAQAQRAADGELSANKEHSLVLDTQIGAALAQLQALEAAVAAQHAQEGQQLQQLRQDLIDPVVQEVSRLQAHKQQLQQLQQEQALAVERLGSALEAVKRDVLFELARERGQLAQAVEELQAVVEGQRVKTEQLGTQQIDQQQQLKKEMLAELSAAMQAAASQLCLASTNFRSAQALVLTAGGDGGGSSSRNPELQSGGGSGAAAAVFDPFSELINRPDSSSQQPEGVEAAAPAPAAQAPAPGSSTVRPTSAAGGVLHAPLSLVLQLQQELASMKADSISKDQFAAVMRMVKELRSHHTPPAGAALEASLPTARNVSTSAAAVTEAQAAPAACDAPGDLRASSTDTVSEVLQQHSQQLAAVEAALEALQQRAAAAEGAAAEQHACVLAMQEQQQEPFAVQSAPFETERLSSSIARVEAAVQQQDATLAAGLASVSSTQAQVQELSGQHSTMQAELHKVSDYVAELAGKMHSAANAAAMAVRPDASSAAAAAAAGGASGGFSEMVGGLSNLKACLDQQARAVAALTARLEDQDSVLQGLMETVATQHGRRDSTSNVAVRGSQGWSADSTGSVGAPGTSAAADSDSANSSNVSRAELADLAAQLAAVQAKLAVLEQQQQRTQQQQHSAASEAVSAAVVTVPEEAAETDADSDAETDDGQQPLGFLHGMLVKLTKRVDRAEEHSIEAKAAASAAAAAVAATATAAAAAAAAAAETAAAAPQAGAAATAAAAASAPGTPTRNKPSAGVTAARRGAAFLPPGHSQNAAAGLQELQEWLACLQGEVARLDAQDTSIAATVESMRGDVGAAAAAAAAATVAASSSLAAAAAWDGDSATATQQAQIDSQQLKQELLAELSAAIQAAAAPPVVQNVQDSAAVALISERVAELQVMVAEVAEQAAAAMAAAAAAAVAATKASERQAHEVPVPASTPAALAATPALADDAAGVQQQSAVREGAESLQAAGGASLPRCLSFGDLASSSNGGGTAAAQASSLSALAPMPEALAWGDGAAAAADQELGGATFEAPPAAPSGQVSRAGSSRNLSRSSTSTSSRSSSGGDRSSKLSVRQLLEEMSALPAPKQVAIVSKLAGLVSTHAARLLVTYSDDPQLSSQLQTVQLQLSTAVRGAAASPTAAGAATASTRSRGKAAGSTSLRHSSSALTSSTAAAGGSGEALLCILDQVASLRAIGSTTHPAISDTLAKHEAQLAELREAQQAIQAAIAVMAKTGSAADSAWRADLSQPAASSVSVVSSSGADGAAAVAPDGSAAAVSLDPEGSSELAVLASAQQQQQQQQTGEVCNGELANRLADVETRLAAGLRVLSAVRNKLPPLQVVADATQGMMRELQVAQGLALQRLEALEQLAASGVAAALAAAPGAEQEGSGGSQQPESLPGGVLVVAGSLKRLQEDLQAASRRLTSLEASVACQVPECVALSRRLAARQADAEARSSRVTDKVSSLASALAPLVDRVAELETRLHRSLAIAKQGLDILADQLVALGALNGRSSPNKNPLAALGPHHAAMTALEGKVEAVRTAMTASVKLMIEEIAAAVEACDAAGSIRAAMGPVVGPGVAALQAVAEQAARAAATSHDEAMTQLESKLASMQAELRANTARLEREREAEGSS